MSRSDVEMSGIVLGIVVQNRHAYRQASGRVSRKISCSVHSEVAWWPILCVLVTSTIADIATMAAKAATSSHISFHHNFIIIYEYICTIIYIYAYIISPMAVSLFTSKARRPSQDCPRPHCTSP